MVSHEQARDATKTVLAGAMGGQLARISYEAGSTFGDLAGVSVAGGFLVALAAISFWSIDAVFDWMRRERGDESEEKVKENEPLQIAS